MEARQGTTHNDAPPEAASSTAARSYDTRRHDITGARRGRLEVAGVARTRKEPGRDRVTHWEIRCDCGRKLELTARQFRLRRGEACGRCLHVEEFARTFAPAAGQKFTLAGFSHFQESPTGAQGHYVWDCLCDCGETFKVSSHHIKDARSCPACSRRRAGERAIGKSRPTRRNVPTPEIVRLLEEAYAYTGPDDQKARRAPTLRQIAERTGWKASALRDLATKLNLSQSIGRPLAPWSEAERAVAARLRRASFGRTKAVLALSGHTRSSNEIRDKIRELAHLEHAPTYAADEVARLLGFDDASRVLALAGAGKLRRAPEATDAFPRGAIKEFLLAHPEDYDLARVERVFFIMLVLRDAFAAPSTAAHEAAAEETTPS